MREIKESKGQSKWKKEVRPSEARGCKRDFLVVQGLRRTSSTAAGHRFNPCVGKRDPTCKNKSKSKKGLKGKKGGRLPMTTFDMNLTH